MTEQSELIVFSDNQVECLMQGLDLIQPLWYTVHARYDELSATIVAGKGIPDLRKVVASRLIIVVYAALSAGIVKEIRS